MKITTALSALALVSTMLLFACNGGEKTKQTDTASEPTTTTAVKYTVSVNEASGMSNFPALQSFGLGQLAFAGDIGTGATGPWDAWLLVGGRTNQTSDNGGLHDLNVNSYSTDASFPVLSFNDSMYVYIPAANKRFAAAVADLISWPGSDSLAMQMASGNMQVCQVGNTLYLAGGYKVFGNSTTATSITFDYLTAIDIELAMAVIVDHALNPGSGQSLKGAMAWTQDPFLRATGGELKVLDDGNFHLVVGQYFSNSSGTEVQTYTQAVRKFSVSQSGNTLTLANKTTITDGNDDCNTQFRRRDLPVLPALDANGNSSIAIFSGVFNCGPNAKANGGCNQADCFGRWPNPLYIFQDGSYDAVDSNLYKQSSNFYATSSIVVYDSDTDSLYSTLIGGIGEVQNGVVHLPFTNKVLQIARATSGGLPVEHAQADINVSSNYYGAESNTVITAENLLYNGKEIIDGKQLSSTPTLVGYMVGGIEAFQTGPGTYGPGNSAASGKVFEIKIARN